MRRISFFLAAAAVSLPSAAFAATTYQVGPSRQYTSLQQLEATLEPGDIVEVDGDATYPGDIHIRPASAGTEADKITIRGVTVNGKRPTISGGSEFGIVLHGNHTVFENFEVTGSQGACVINKAHDLTLRNLEVHDCPGQGILGMDTDAGDQTLEYLHVYRTGGGLYDHQIYLANDQTLYPNARIRIQHSYIHDGLGGNNVKSRASRNEIYNNWIESPHYHVLDLIGADGQEQSLAREDSDVVGNVLIQTSEYTIARMGGDGTGASNGRYRFAYNTIVMSPTQQNLFRAIGGIESIAFHDNVFVAPEGNTGNFLESDEAEWTSGPQIAAQGNFFQTPMVVPDFFTSSITGADAGFTDYSNGDLTPAAGSPLVDAGMAGTGPASFEVPDALLVPTAVPPARFVNENLAPLPRSSSGTPDVGAYELGSPTDPGGGSGGGGSGGEGQGGSDGNGAGLPGGGSGDDDGGLPGGGDGGGSNGDGLDSDGSASDEGGCSVTSAAGSGATGLLAMTALIAALRRRRSKK